MIDVAITIFPYTAGTFVYPHLTNRSQDPTPDECPGLKASAASSGSGQSFARDERLATRAQVREALGDLAENADLT
jgi:hypothetical protein